MAVSASLLRKGPVRFSPYLSGFWTHNFYSFCWILILSLNFVIILVTFPLRLLSGSEFCEVVSKIHIYTQEEVEKMTMGMISEDTQSCLEEAPVIIDVSKSSPGSQPNSSPAIIMI